MEKEKEPLKNGNNELIKQICQEYKFWDKLDEESKERIISETIIERYSKNEIIYNPSQICKGIIKVLKGNLRIYMISEDGKEVTIYRLSEGEECVLSASCIIEEVMFETFMKAEEDVEIAVTNVFVLKALMEKNVFLENYIYKETVAKFSEIMWNIQDMLFTRVDKRLALFLLKQEKNSEINLTHEEIASHLGTAREVVSRVLKKFEKEELIKLSRGKITILEFEKLKKIL